MTYSEALVIPDTELAASVSGLNLPPSAVRDLTVHIAVVHPDGSLFHETLVHEFALGQKPPSDLEHINWGDYCSSTMQGEPAAVSLATN